MTITEFLLARIAEDEAIAQRQRADLEKEFGKAVEVRLFSELGQEGLGDMGYPAIVVDGTRVLAECEAKRRIVAEHGDQHHCVRWNEAIDPHACPTLRAHASVYADHPDFDLAWRLPH